MTNSKLSMPIMYLPRLQEVERMSTQELRSSLLIDRLFEPGQLVLRYTNLDRLIVGGIMPQSEIALPAYEQLGTRYFTERREIGVINIGDPGEVIVSGQRHALEKLDCLYIGAGEEDIRFASGSGQPAFFLLSCPVHKALPTRKVSPGEAEIEEFGDCGHASRRRRVKLIHPHGLSSGQLVMGFTELEGNNVWNTMPPHTHSRRSEIYFYFDLGEDEIVVHMMGVPDSTRHLIVRNRQAVLSPSWSIHAGAGSTNYRFVWGMVGENQDFADVDAVRLKDLY